MTIRIDFLTLGQEHEDGREESWIPTGFQVFYYQRLDDGYVNEDMYTLHVHFEGHKKWSTFAGITKDMVEVLVNELRDREVPEEGTFSQNILGY